MEMMDTPKTTNIQQRHATSPRTQTSLAHPGMKPGLLSANRGQEGRLLLAGGYCGAFMKAGGLANHCPEPGGRPARDGGQGPAPGGTWVSFRRAGRGLGGVYWEGSGEQAQPGAPAPRSPARRPRPALTRKQLVGRQTSRDSRVT